MLLERTKGPTDKVCGDFLGADAIGRLRGLGVDPADLGAAPIHCLRLLHRDRQVETALPFQALGLSRRVLDDALQHRARDAGAILRMAATVRRISRFGSGWHVGLDRDETIEAADVFLATGKHDLRDLPRPGVRHGAVGMKMYFRLAPLQGRALAGAIELILFPGGYAGLQCVEDGKAVLCAAFRRDRLTEVGGTWAGLLAELQAGSILLRDRLAGAVALLPRPLAVAGIPYGFLHRDSLGAGRGMFRLGDQTAVIPSLTGDGIAIALHSGSLVAQCWLDGQNAKVFHDRLAEDLGGQMRLAGMLHGLAMTGPLQAAGLRAATLFPALLRHAARGTRIRRAADPGQVLPSSGLHPA